MGGGNKRVNLKVDSVYSLVDIMDVEDGWQTCHQLKALARDGKSRVLYELAMLKQQQEPDHKKLLRALRLAGENPRVTNPRHVKQGKVHKDIYEMRADKGLARLMFFYAPPDETVVCTELFRKTDGGKDGQDTAFRRSEAMRQAYLEQLKAENREDGHDKRKK